MNRFAVYLFRTDESICRAVFELADRRSPDAPLFDVSVCEKAPNGQWYDAAPSDRPAGAWTMTDIMAAAMLMGAEPRVAQLGDLPAMPVWVVYESAALGAKLPVSLADLFRQVGGLAA